MGNLDDYAWFARSGASVAPGGGSIGDPFGMPGFPGLPGMMPEDFDAALRSKRKKTSASADRPSSMRDAGSKANEVGRKRPNAFGLHDMYGNVWEMCSDWYAKDYYRRSPTENPKGADTGTHHVARGGGWSSDPAVPSPRSGLQPFHRGGIEPQGYRDFIGFRVVCDVRDGTAGQPSPQPSPPEDDDPLK
jgi:hypothetical protein